MVNTRMVQACFLSLLFIGIGHVVVGLVVEPALPYFALDRVLTQPELKDEQKVRSTLLLLQRAWGNHFLLSTIGGAAGIAISILGIITLRRMPSCSKMSSAGNQWMNEGETDGRD